MASPACVSVDALPMLPGRLPFVGHMPRCIRGFPELIFEGRDRFGPLFRMDMGRVRDLVVIADIEGMRLLVNRQAASDVLEQLAGPMIDNSMVTLDGPRHRRLRSAVRSPFAPRGLDATSVGPLIAAETRELISTWTPGRPVRILDRMQRLTLAIFFRVIGCPARELSGWARLYERMHLGSFGVPGLLYLARRAQEQLHRKLRVIITELRESGERETIVGSLAHGTDDEGQLLAVEELVSTLRILVLAGHETSAASAAWSVLELAHRPNYWARLVEEARGVERAPETMAELDQVPFARAFIREIIRRYPPLTITARRLTDDVELLGHRLPRGAVIVAPICMLNLDPQLFDAPEQLRPERWLDEGDDGAKPTPSRELERLAFGLAGPHFCLGYHLAILELTHLLVALAKHFGPAGRSPTLRGGPMPGKITFPFTRPVSSATVWIE